MTSLSFPDLLQQNSYSILDFLKAFNEHFWVNQGAKSNEFENMSQNTCQKSYNIHFPEVEV